MTPALTAAAASSVLAAAMDGRAHNIEQARLLFNPSPEIDSLAEIPALLMRHDVPVDVVHQTVMLIRKVLESNVAEGRCEMQIAGAMESHLSRVKLAPLAERVTAKQIAVRVRDALAILVDPAAHDGVEYFKACGVVRDEIRRCPREQLLAPAVRTQLRDRKFNKLVELAEACS